MSKLEVTGAELRQLGDAGLALIVAFVDELSDRAAVSPDPE